MESLVEKGFFMAKNIPKISCPHHQKIFKKIISCSLAHIVHLLTLMLTRSQNNVIG
jgi:hypothetical protein